jgi:anti-anti-sigma regulatory factor
MLRITRIAEVSARVILKVEGRVVDEWTALLGAECDKLLGEGAVLVLDFSEVKYIDLPGIEVLGKVQARGATIVGCSEVIRDLLGGGGCE